MRIRLAAFSLAALAGIAVLTAAPSRAVATEGALADMYIADANPSVISIMLVANPDALGTPLHLTFSPLGSGETMIVGHAVLNDPMTMVPVPNSGMPGEYGCTVDSRVVRYDPGNH
jgi:hypothetical protein